MNESKKECSCGCSHSESDGMADALLQYRMTRLKYARLFCLILSALWPMVAIVMKINLAFAAIISGLALLGFLAATLKLCFLKAMDRQSEPDSVPLCEP